MVTPLISVALFLYYQFRNHTQKVLIPGKLIIPELSEPPVRTLGATIPENESHIFR